MVNFLVFCGVLLLAGGASKVLIRVLERMENRRSVW